MIPNNTIFLSEKSRQIHIIRKIKANSYHLIFKLNIILSLIFKFNTQFLKLPFKR